jgi:hypothetical protein
MGASSFGMIRNKNVTWKDFALQELMLIFDSVPAVFVSTLRVLLAKGIYLRHGAQMNWYMGCISDQPGIWTKDGTREVKSLFDVQ